MKKNKIKIYQCFLYQRMFFVIGFIFIVVSGINSIKNTSIDSEIGELLFWFIFFLLGTYIPFFNYICLDKKKNIIILRQMGKKRVIISLDKLKKLYLNINPKDEKDFAIDLIYDDEVKRFDYWSEPKNDASFSYFFTVTSRHQRKRLQRFIDQCNEYLETYQRTIASESQEIQEQNKENFSNDNE